MNIDLNTIEHLARLSKLHFSEEEKMQLVADVQRMVSFVEQLDSAALDAYPPTQHMLASAAHVREDAPAGAANTEEIMSNAPAAHEGYFIVPKVIATPQ